MLVSFPRAVTALVVQVVRIGPQKVAAKVYRADLAYLLALAGLVALLFRHFLLGRAVFIGNTDRLNNYLNMLRFHVDGIRGGRLNAWNENLFGGMNSFALAYTFPNPLTYLVSLAPPDQLFFAANLVSFALLAAAGWASFAFLRSICDSPRHAFVGAALYELCFLSVLKMSQNDMSFAVLIVIPLMLLAIRRIRPGNQCGPFVALTLLLAGLVFFTFLQEAAYALLLGGLYALYRSAAQRSWRPICVFAAASLIGLLGAGPRLVTVHQDLALTVRSTSPPWNWPPAIDGLRFFSDALFGRNQLDSRSLGNGITHSEGMLLFISCFAPWLLLAGICRFRGGWFRLPFGRSGEAGFFFWVIVGTLAIVYVTPLYNLFHLLFQNADFIHARLLTITLLPLCVLVTVLLRDWEGNDNRHRLLPLLTGVAVALSLVAAIHFLARAGDSHRKLFLHQTPASLMIDIWRTLTYLPADPSNLPDSLPVWSYTCGYVYLAGYALRQIFWSAVTFAVIGGLFWRWRHVAERRSLLATCLAGLMIGQTFLAASYRVNGPHGSRINRARNVDTDDLQRASPEEFRVPSEAAAEAMASRLETDRYRSVILVTESGWGLAAPHLAPFWRLRLLEGYSSAIPLRLYAMPFPAATIYGRRAIGYHRLDDLDWRFLGLLNVKYGVVKNETLYRNSAELPDGCCREASPSDVAILENPCPVVPRVFFAKRVKSVNNTRAAIVALFGGQVFQMRGDLASFLPGTVGWNDSTPDIVDPRIESVVEGGPAQTTYEADGAIEVKFAGDHIDVNVEPSDHPRFLVLNELYHPGWSAAVDGRLASIYPTNVFMRGLVVPSGTTQVVLRFRPWVASPTAWTIYVIAFAILIGGAIGLRWYDRLSVTFIRLPPA